jgi:hypothetical protein
VISYAPLACPAVKPYVNGQWGDAARCRKGDQCEYAHTANELLYHPQVYKVGARGAGLCARRRSPRDGTRTRADRSVRPL